MIAFGKPATGRINPTAFLYGEVKGETGIFMSVDMGNQLGAESTMTSI